MCQQKVSEIFIVVSSEDGHWDADGCDDDCDTSTDDIREIVSLPTDEPDREMNGTYPEVLVVDLKSSSESSETFHSWLTPSTTPQELIVSAWLPAVYPPPEMDMSHIKLFVTFLIRKVLTV